MNGYELSRQWFDFAFENPEKITPTHGMIYFFAIEQWNRLGQKEKFGLPTMHTMETIGIKSKNTYYKAFHELVEFGFFKVIEFSKNQNSANIISLSAVSNFESAGKSALDSATIQHECRQGTHNRTNKQENNKTNIFPNIQKFWNELKAKSDSQTNPTFICGNNIFPQCRRLNEDQTKKFLKNTEGFTEREIKLSIIEYAKEIGSRGSNDYASHRFYFSEFFSQKNGFQKFISLVPTDEQN